MWLNGLRKFVFSVPEAEHQVCREGSGAKKEEVKSGRKSRNGLEPRAVSWRPMKMDWNLCQFLITSSFYRKSWPTLPWS